MLGAVLCKRKLTHPCILPEQTHTPKATYTGKHHTYRLPQERLQYYKYNYILQGSKKLASTQMAASLVCIIKPSCTQSHEGCWQTNCYKAAGQLLQTLLLKYIEAEIIQHCVE